MRKIKINAIQKADKSSLLTRRRRNSISLGNGQTVYFSNIHAARAFQAATNKFLNNKAIEINLLFIDVWVQYRRLYVVFYDLLARDQSIKKTIDNIDTDLRLLLTRSGFANGEFFTFARFYTILQGLTDFARLVHGILIQKKRNYNTFEMYVLINRLDQLKKDFDTWGADQGQTPPAAPWDQK